MAETFVNTAVSAQPAICQGSFHAFFLYDVADEIRLETLAGLVGGRAARPREFKRPAPDYVRFVRPPLVAPGDPLQVPGGREFTTCFRFFDHGVVTLDLEFGFETGWRDLIAWSSQWMNDPQLEKLALERARAQVELATKALVRPYAGWLDENYCVIHLRSVRTSQGECVSAAELQERFGSDLTQIVRGESEPLAPSTQRELLSSSMSYFPSDLLLVGWAAAVVYDTPEAAESILQLLEYANVQLIEYRFYDETLTRVLQQAYATLEHRRGMFSGWRLAKEAERLDTLRLDIRELAERTQNAIKFISDMYYARAFQLATAKVGASDYHALVESKLQIAGELYQSMVNEFREMRSFLLELIVVVILIIELVMLFRGQH